MLTGPNGLLTQADAAKTKTTEAGAKEKVQIAVAGSWGENGFDPEKFKTEVGRFDGEITLGEEEFPIKVTVDGQNFEVSNEGVVTEKGGSSPTTPQPGGETFDENKLTIGEEKATNTEKYGWKVKNYNVQYDCVTGTGKSNVWRLFYQDEKYTYLITDELVGSYKPSDYYDNEDEEDQEKYKDGTKMSIVGQKLNGRVSTLFTDETKKSQHNIKATVWFTDITNELWTKYMDKKENGEKGDAEFCIASPTAELFEASYNKNTNPTHNAYKDNKIDVQLGNYGYSENTSDDWFRAEDSNGIYNKDDSSYWWLASPNYDGSSHCLYVSGNGRLFQHQRRVQHHLCGSPNSLYSNI